MQDLGVAQQEAIVKKLSLLDRFLPLWIFISMAFGVGIGYIFPQISKIFDALRIDTVSLPIAVGLLWMMYPILAKVKYEKLDKVLKSWKLFIVSIFLNWLIGPALMFSLAWLFLSDLPQYREGLIIVGLARCIAMVLIWNLLAGGDNESCAILVAINSILQILLYSVLAYFYLGIASSWLGGAEAASSVNFSLWDIARSVLIFLGIPLAAGMATRFYLRKRRGGVWYDQVFMPKLGPTAIVGLLFTIVVMFSMKGEYILALPFDVLRISIPLVFYFLIMFSASFIFSWLLKFDYPKTATLSFTAASNNFELAIAVAVAVFGISSGQALAAVVGPLIEVPVLIGLVYLVLRVRKFFFVPKGTPKTLKTFSFGDS